MYLFENHLYKVAAAYGTLREDLFVAESHATHLDRYWNALAAESQKMAADIRLLLQVTEVDRTWSYATANDMVTDIARGRLVVSVANSEHPQWTPAENVAFRIVHDVYGHFSASVRNGYPADLIRGTAAYGDWSGTLAGFDWPGECGACEAHARRLTQDARRALLTECLGQTGFAIASGNGFGRQYVGDLYPHLPADEIDRWQRLTSR